MSLVETWKREKVHAKKIAPLARTFALVMRVAKMDDGLCAVVLERPGR